MTLPALIRTLEAVAMPVHDWSRVEAGIFHHFHHSWIEELMRTLNSGVLPNDYYALAEQHAAGFGPDVLTLQPAGDEPTSARTRPSAAGTGLLLTPPNVRYTAETDMELYRRKQSRIVVRHATGDWIVAMIEVVSPGNKASRGAFRAFVEKAAELLDQHVHLLILDLHRPTQCDPHGVHAAIWEEIAQQEETAATRSGTEKPLTLISYESAQKVRASLSRWRWAKRFRKCRSIWSRARTSRSRWRKPTRRRLRPCRAAGEMY
jgi:hypothetical protein